MSKILAANLFLVLCTIIWGGTFIVLKFALEDVSPLILVSMRFGIASFLLILFISLKKNRRKSFAASLKEGTVLKHGIYLGLMTITGFGLQTIGIQYTTASRSAFITELLILFTPLFQYILYRRLPGSGNYFGMLLILPGMYLLTSFRGYGMNKGDMITFLCAIGFAMYIVYLDHYSKIHDEIHLLFWQMISTSLFSLILAFAAENIVFSIDYGSLISLLYLSIVGTLVAVYWQTKYQKNISPINAGILYSMEPVFAVMFAYTFLGERPKAFFYPGAALILAGVVLSSVIDGRKKWMPHYH